MPAKPEHQAPSGDAAREAESARRHIEDVLKRELRLEAEKASEDEHRDVRAVAHELKQHAIEGISESERLERRKRRLARVYQFVDYLFFVIYALIGLLVGLELLGARDRSAFMQFLKVVTAPLLAPFKGLMPDPAVGSSQLMTSYLIAIVVYVLLQLGVKRLFAILAHRAPERM